MRAFWRALTFVVAVPVVYVLAAFLGAVVPGPVAEVGGAPTERIALARGPIHYDILIPLTPAARADFGFARAAGLPVDHPAAEWLVVGWGAAGFYTTVGSYGDITAPVLWRAVSGDDAVIRLDLAGNVDAVEGLVWLEVSAAQIDAMRGAVLQSLARDGAGQPLPAETAPWGESHRFFAATGRFNIFHTCNVWTGETLRAAGISFGLWTPTPQAVNLSLWWHGT